MKKKNKKNFEKGEKIGKFSLPVKAKRYILGVVMFLIATIVSLSFFELSGPAGQFLMRGFSFLIGKVVFVIPLILLISGLIFFKPFSVRKIETGFWPVFLAIIIFIIGISGILEAFYPGQKMAGIFGYLTAFIFLKFFGALVTKIVFGAVIIIGGIIFWQLLTPTILKKPVLEPSFSLPPSNLKKEEKKPLITRIFKMGEPKFKVKEISPPPLFSQQEIEKPEKIPPATLKTKPIESEPSFLKESNISYQLPPIELLEAEKGGPAAGDTRINSLIIKRTLQNFDIPVEMSEINIGPTVTQYTLKPAEGIKLSKITALSNDLALALASHPIRIEAPIPGRSLVGIEVPNKIRAQVRLRNLIQNPDFHKYSSGLVIVLGRDVSGNPVYADLARMPHLLVAGSTGTGKTIFINNLILSLLYRSSPQILRFILIDPKRVEFPVYGELPHLLAPVIYDATRTVGALKWLISEMERRFEILAASKTRDIISYNLQKKGKEEIMPYIVLIVDELADLMAAKGREIEAGIVRLAQMARAVGIHLVVATQRPSVEVITGLIKANITSRLTFQVASQVDSRTVLDASGAEKLLGMGDFLYVSAEVGKPKRIQAPYVSEREVRKVIGWIKNQPSTRTDIQLDDWIKMKTENGLAQDLEKSLEMTEEKTNDEDDLLYEEAKRVVIEAKKASASLLQRKLRIGYARAARLIDMLEERGIVGPGEGAKPREVYFPDKENNDWKKV